MYQIRITDTTYGHVSVVNLPHVGEEQARRVFDIIREDEMRTNRSTVALVDTEKATA